MDEAKHVSGLGADCFNVVGPGQIIRYPETGVLKVLDRSSCLPFKKISKFNRCEQPLEISIHLDFFRCGWDVVHIMG